MSDYFLTSRHGNCGSSVMFHNLNECGYGTNIRNLQTYTQEEAQKHHDHYGRDSLPLLVNKVMEKATRRVDHQYIDIAKGCPRGNVLCVVSSGSWVDGNDIGFKSKNGRITYNLKEAESKPLSEWEKLNYYNVIWSLEYLMEKCRLTFQSNNINTRSMCKGVKLQRKKIRTDSGKTRWNCPACGKINWQYNPYDFDGCSDIMCDEYRF